MAGQSKRPGDDEADRTRDLRRSTVQGGGEVWSGPLAREALEAVGARAMTVDKTILVDEDFDPTDVEDQALYAHERHHQLRSGGTTEHGGGSDAEEEAAKAIERMVLHRRAHGEDFGSILQDVESGRVEDPAHTGGPANAAGTEGDDPMAAYRALRAMGWTHDSIVRMLSRHVLSQMQQQESDRSARGPLTSSMF